MRCPVCSGDMWDNRANKRNPKGPDFTCKQMQGPCKFAQNPDTKEWEPSEFKTAVWMPKEKGPGLPPKSTIFKRTPQPQVQETVNEDLEPDWDKIAEGKVRHGVVTAMISNGRTYEEILKDHGKYVRLIMGKTTGADESGIDIDNIPF